MGRGGWWWLVVGGGGTIYKSPFLSFAKILSTILAIIYDNLCELRNVKVRLFQNSFLTCQSKLMSVDRRLY